MAGSKRTSSGQNQSDFKRLKAKVGKRALKPANVTDTTFKAASLHLGGQSIDNLSSESSMMSTRGKSFSELILQLGHPAAAVRLSAMKGFGNVVSQQSPHSIRPYLSDLLPACSKSCVDEDQDVRSVGLSVFGGLLPQQDEATMRPFASLLVAYATSALHSLDSPMRIDGARFINLLCSTYPSLIRPFAPKLLPPFVGLLADRKSSEIILQALVSSLRTSQENNRDLTDIHDNDEPDLNYLLGGRSRNALVLETRKPEVSFRLFSTIRELPSLDQVLSTSDSFPITSFDQNEEALLDVNLIYDLLSKLRDALIEATDQDHAAPGTVASTPMNTEKVKLLIQAIHLLWKMQGSTPPSAVDENDAENLNKLGVKIALHLLELFPVTQEDARGNDATIIDSLNAIICTTTIEIASLIPSNSFKSAENDKADWAEIFCSYLLPRLEKWATAKSASSGLDIFCELLVLGEEKSNLASKHLIMLERLYNVFFESDNVALSRSDAGRKIAVTCVEKMMKHHQCGLEEIESSFSDIFFKIIQKLPSYLIAWGADYAYESKVILRFLHDVARRSSNLETNPTLAVIRESMSELVYVAGEKSKTKKSRDKSIFEHYSTSLQRTFLGLLVMLRSPSSETLKGLAAVCSTLNNRPESSTLGDEIIESIHSVRKTIPMQGYLSFLVNSIGIPKASNRVTNEKVEPDCSEKEIELVLMLDRGICRVCHELIHCGSVQALKMLLPHFSSWLEKGSNMCDYDLFLRSRVAVAIIAMLSLDMKNLDKKSSIFNFVADMMQRLTVAICQALSFVASIDSALEEKSQLISPFIAMIQAEPLLLDHVFKHFAESMSKKDFKMSGQAKIIQILIECVKDPRLINAVEDSKESVSFVRSMESEVEKGSTQQMTVQLRAILEVKIKN